MKKSIEQINQAKPPKNLEQGKELNELIHDKQFILGDTGLTPRLLNHYAGLGLFVGEKEGKRHRRRFSFVELVWIRIIIDLREFGLSLDAIGSLKKQLIDALSWKDYLSILESSVPDQKDSHLIQQISKEDAEQIEAIKKELGNSELSSGISVLALLITDFVMKRKQYELKIESNGQLHFGDKAREDLPTPKGHYINLSFTEVMKQLLGDQGSLEKLPDVKVITDQEQEVLKHIRKGNLKELTVRFNKENEISLIETKQTFNKVDVEARYMDHILKGGFHEISYITKDGKIVGFNRTTKHKV